MNIRLRLTLWYSVILFLILLVFGIAVYVGLSRSLFVSVDNQLQREAAQIIGALKFSGDADNDERETVADYKKTAITLDYTPEEGIYWRILTNDGQPVVDPGYFENASFDEDIITAHQVHFDYATLVDETSVRLYTAPFIIEQQGQGIIQVAERYQHIKEVQNQLVFLLVVSIPFIMLATSAGGWFLAASALNPIARITQATNRISAKDLHQRLNLNLPNDEVGQLAATFDKMLARLENSFERQKRFISDASHEMRTPLTILKGEVEVALNRPRNVTEYQETLEMVNQTTDRLIDLVEELFILARADNNQYSLQPVFFDLAAMLNKEISKLRTQAAQKNIVINFDVPDSLFIEADPAKLTRLFINLVDNAIKYSNPGDFVNITASIKNEQACITVADTGPGIPNEYLPHLFDRFYRVDKARSRNLSSQKSKSGSGLGLSIVQWLVEAHKGHITVTSELGQGTAFILWLPLKYNSSEP